MATDRQSVLVVDDEMSICEMMASALEDRGYEARTACTGTEAVRELAGRPDSVILDTLLPDMTGFEVAVHAARRRVPVIMMSGAPRGIMMLEEAGWPHLIKPFRLTQLLAEVERTIAHGQEVRQVMLRSLRRLMKTVEEYEMEVLHARALQERSIRARRIRELVAKTRIYKGAAS